MPSEVGAEDMVSKQDDGTSGDSQAETTEFTSLDNTGQEENGDCSHQDVENEDNTIRNNNYTYHNAAESQNLDNALISLSREAVVVIMENASTETDRIRDAENNPTEPSRCQAEAQSNSSSANDVDMAAAAVSSSGTIDNTTQTSLQDMQPDSVSQLPKNEPARKNFTRCLESSVNNSASSQSSSGCCSLYSNDNDSRSDSIDGAAAAALPLQIPVVDSSSGEGSSSAACDSDVVMVSRNKPFKLPSLVNLYEAAEAQRAEMEDRAVLNAMSSIDIDSGMFMGSSEGSNSDTESQQVPNYIFGTKKVCVTDLSGCIKV